MIQMNITQLQYLVDVGELGSFTNAAKKNDVTIPAISISINKLEKIFGVPLFTRSKKGVVPTTEGKVCIQHAITMLKTAEKMKKEDRKSTRLNSSHVAISYADFCLKKKNKLKLKISYFII